MKAKVSEVKITLELTGEEAALLRDLVGSATGPDDTPMGVLCNGLFDYLHTSLQSNPPFTHYVETLRLKR